MASKAIVPLTHPLAVVPRISVFEKILNRFPKEYFRFCFAYGSGVLPQSGTKVGKPMIDLIFAVHDTLGFHWRNLQQNPDDYSSMRHFGPRLISLFQRKIPSAVYFNTLVPLHDENVVFKYGVIHFDDFVDDMLDWNYMYVAGRMHKPVKILTPVKHDYEILDMALRQNLLSALHIAFLMLPEFFTERELYWTLANLSYCGDFRMVFGEDKNKVNNIIDKQLPKFRKMYKPYLDGIFYDYARIQEVDSFDGVSRQDMSTNSRMYHLNMLPPHVLELLANLWRKKEGRKKSTQLNMNEEAVKYLSCDIYHPQMLATVLAKIVFRSSALQSLKGIFTAGLTKSAIYSRTKVEKMIKSQKSPT